MREMLAVVLCAVGMSVGAGWLADPLAWKIVGNTASCRQNGFAFAECRAGREVAVRARVTPTACTNASWSTAGIAIYGDAKTFWHLAFVKQPQELKSKHVFELGMMLEGEWPVQHRLACRESRTLGRWEFGRAYDFTLKMDAEGVRGEIVDVESGKPVFVNAYAFTAKAADRGVPALHVTGDFKAAFSELSYAVAQPAAKTAETAVPYPTRTATGAVSRATGFFRVERRDGRWSAIDPNGSKFVVLGVDHVQPWGMFCETWGYSPYGRHVKASYPSLGAWADETLGRLKSWGFTALGAGCDFVRLGRRGLVHTVFLSMGSRLCYDDGAWWIRPSLHAPCTAFPNVFHPDFARACDWVASQKCQKDDPWLFGYFIDNELAWWGKGDRATGMFDTVRQLPEGHSARVALEEFLKRPGRDAPGTAKGEVDAATKLAFLELVADRYFAATTAAIRKYDPNHLILGCRFAGLGGAHEVVWKTAAKYCDVVTFNCYPWADLDRNVVLDRKGGEPIVRKFDELAARVGRPMLLTEWSFPALDAGRPCLHGAGQRFATQALRVRATELFAKTLLALPYFIGYDYFMWVDQPAPGMNHNFPEDSNYGLVQENGAPHLGITAMFAALHRDVERWRTAGLPAERTYEEPAWVAERERFLAEAKGPGRDAPGTAEGEAVRFVRTGEGWTLSNDAGLELRGVTAHGGDMVRTVALGGRVVGSLGGLVEVNDAIGHGWIDARGAKRVQFVREGVCGSVLATAEGEHRGRKFELTLRVTLAPGRKDFVGEIVAVRNLGRSPLEVSGLYLRPFAAEPPAGECPRVPNLWKGAAESHWLLRGGGTYGLVSHDATVSRFQLWLNREGGQHPDAIFVPSVPLTLAPGGEYYPSRPMSALVKISN